MTYLLAAAVLLPVYGRLRAPLVLLVLGPFVAFFGTGYFCGFGAVIAGDLSDGDSRDRAGF